MKKILEEFGRRVINIIWKISKKYRITYCATIGHTHNVCGFKTKDFYGGYCAICGYGIYSNEYKLITQGKSRV